MSYALGVGLIPPIVLTTIHTPTAATAIRATSATILSFLFAVPPDGRVAAEAVVGFPQASQNLLPGLFLCPQCWQYMLSPSKRLNCHAL